jgi:hypothetical protein
MESSPNAPLVDLHDLNCRFRVTLSEPYGQQVADLTMSGWRDAIFEVDAYPFSARAETTFTSEEVDVLLALVERFWQGEDIVFDEDQQFRRSLTHEESAVVVATTLSKEGWPYPEIRFRVRPGWGIGSEQ